MHKNSQGKKKKKKRGERVGHPVLANSEHWAACVVHAVVRERVRQKPGEREKQGEEKKEEER